MHEGPAAVSNVRRRKDATHERIERKLIVGVCEVVLEFGSRWQPKGANQGAGLLPLPTMASLSCALYPRAMRKPSRIVSARVLADSTNDDQALTMPSPIIFDHVICVASG